MDALKDGWSAIFIKCPFQSPVFRIYHYSKMLFSFPAAHHTL
jgi:hypothetical protein